MQIDTRYPLQALESSFQNTVEQVVAVRKIAFTRDSQLQYGLIPEGAREDEDAAHVFR